MNQCLGVEPEAGLKISAECVLTVTGSHSLVLALIAYPTRPAAAHVTFRREPDLK